MAESFDIPRWKARISEAHRLVVDDYPAGFLAWALECAPDIVEKLRATVEAAKGAYLEGDPKSLGKALNAYIRAHYQSFEKYRSSIDGLTPQRG